MTYVVTAQRRNGTSTFLCSSMALALDRARYFQGCRYGRISITAPDGTVLTPEALANLMELSVLPDDDAVPVVQAA